MSRLRILHLGKFYPPVRGGMETVLQTLCRGEQRAVQTRALVMNRCTQDDARRRRRRARHARRELADGRRRGRGADAAALARARRGRPHRAPRAQPDGAAGVLRRATDGAAHHLVPQRGRAARLALPALLSSAPRIRPASRRARRRRVAADDGRRRRSRRIARSVSSSPTGSSRIAIGRRPQCGESATRCAQARADRSCCSSGAWCRTRDSTSCSARCPDSTRRLVIVGDGPLRGALETMVRELRPRRSRTTGG